MVYYGLTTRCNFLDAAKLPSDSLAKVVAYDVDKLFAKTSTISEGVPFPLKRMGTRILRCPSRGHYAMTLDRGMNNLHYSSI